MLVLEQVKAAHIHVLMGHDVGYWPANDRLYGLGTSHITHMHLSVVE